MRVFVLLTIAIVCASCSTSTPYQEMGSSGGVTAHKMTSDTYRVSARGNGHTTTATVQDYMLLKAAETTKDAGGTHFRVVSSADASRRIKVVTPAQVETTFEDDAAYTTYTPAMVQKIFKPGQDAYIRVLTVPKGSKAPNGAVSADEIIQFVGARVKRG